MQDITLHLGSAGLNGRRYVKEGKARRSSIAFLRRKHGKIERTDVDARGSPGLHARDRNAQFGEGVRDMIGCRLSDAAAFEGMLPDEHLSVQKGSGRQNDGPRMENCPGNRPNAADFAILKEKIFDKIRVNT